MDEGLELETINVGGYDACVATHHVQGYCSVTIEDVGISVFLDVREELGADFLTDIPAGAIPRLKKMAIDRAKRTHWERAKARRKEWAKKKR